VLTTTPTLGASEPAEPLVRAAQLGDRDAFGRLYQRFAGYVHAILLARLPAGEAADLVQDVFLTAFQRLSHLREPAAFSGWIATMARNRATDFLRSRPVTDELKDTSGVPTSPEAALDAARALRTIQRLPEAYRETLVLRLVEGMTGPEIAAATGLSPASVRVNLHRGFKLLRDALGKRDE
jgi:RNA polymerase sigma-70 factor, ECF subfamily